MNIENFESKKTWAVIGSIHNRDKFAYRIFKFLREKGYTVYPVDPSGEDVDNEKTYRTLGELPEKPEVLDMVINPVRGLKYIEEAKNLDIHNIWFQPGAESDEIISSAESNGMDVVYNRCVMVELK